MSDRRFPRTARVNEVLREIVADELEQVSDDDPRLELVTVTGVECDPDLRHATVFYASSRDGVDDALAERRRHLQAAINRQTRLRRTPQLTFVEDPAVVAGERIESILRGLGSADL